MTINTNTIHWLPLLPTLDSLLLSEADNQCGRNPSAGKGVGSKWPFALGNMKPTAL